MNNLFLNILKGRSICGTKLDVSNVNGYGLFALNSMFEFTIQGTEMTLTKFNWLSRTGYGFNDLVEAYYEYPNNKRTKQNIAEWLYEIYGANEDGSLKRIRRARIDLYYLIFKSSMKQ